MQAIVLRAQRTPLELTNWLTPRPGHGQVLLKVRARGVCRTDLHIVDGELDEPDIASGTGARDCRPGDRARHHGRPGWPATRDEVRTRPTTGGQRSGLRN